MEKRMETGWRRFLGSGSSGSPAESAAPHSDSLNTDSLNADSLHRLHQHLASGPNSTIDSLLAPPMNSPVQIPTHYTWEVEGKAVSVQLDFDLIDRLSMEIMRGFALVPKRGAEIGGVLLGRLEISDRVVIRVEDFEVVPCDYLKGPSFLLSPNEEARFAAVAKKYEGGQERQLYVVGTFRSHTRDNQIVLAQEDVDLFRKYANDPSNIILLVRPFATKASIAGIFLEEDGDFRREPSLKEFPFRRRDLGGSPITRASAAEEAPAAPELEPRTPDLKSWGKDLESKLTEASRGPSPTPEEDSASARFRRKWVLIPLSFIFLLLGVVAGFQAALVLNRAEADKLAYESLGLGLDAQREGEGILLRWDRNAPAIRFGRRGTLLIEDGEFKKTVRLDEKNLQNGGILYRGVSAGVIFRLEVETQRRGLVSESIQFNPSLSR